MECALQASGTHCTWYFHLRRSGSRYSALVSDCAVRSESHLFPLNERGTEQRAATRRYICLVLLISLALYFVFVAMYFTARAALYSITLWCTPKAKMHFPFQQRVKLPHGNGNAAKRLSTDMKARARTFHPSQQEQRESAHCRQAAPTAPGIFICVDLDLAMPKHFRRCTRSCAPCVKAPDQPHQHQTMNDAPCLADIASTLLCVCGCFTARAALYSIKLVHSQRMEV
jgi:hypothetical protein